MTLITKLASAAAIALIAGSAYAQNVMFDGPLDTDNNDMLTEEEFAPVASMGGSFAGFDNDGDGMISQIEYNENVASLLPGGTPNDLNAQQIDQVRELQRMFDQDDADRDIIDAIFGDNDGDTEASDS